MACRQRILVMSDTHGRLLYLNRLRDRLGKIDSVIHLGDIARDKGFIESLFECPVDMVQGNNDFYTDLPMEYMIRIGKYAALLTHGHRYMVNYGTERLVCRAKQQNADIVMYGHTHIPLIDTRDGVLLINPGSIAQPRQPGGRRTYVLIEVDEAGEFTADGKEIV